MGLQASARTVSDRPESPYGYIQFNDEDGSIWLDDQRMLLIYDSTYAALRAGLIKALGLDEAKRVLMRLGSA